MKLRLPCPDNLSEITTSLYRIINYLAAQPPLGRRTLSVPSGSLHFIWMPGFLVDVAIWILVVEQRAPFPHPVTSPDIPEQRPGELARAPAMVRLRPWSAPRGQTGGGLPTRGQAVIEY
jgi:hypothetical protein